MENTFTDIASKDESLRGYQQEAKEAIFAAWDEVDSVMFQMPTGTGKTRLFSSIIRDIHDDAVRNKYFYRILIVAHRTELLDQIHDNLRDHYQISTGYIAGGHPREKHYHVQIASIQTISHPNNRQYAQALKFDYVIIDEAHHAIADTYQLLWKLYPKAKRLGVTATPYRLSGCGFTKLFDRLIMSWTVKKFIDEKYLSPYQYYSLKPSGSIQRSIDNIDEFALDGDYKTSALERVMDRGTIRAQLWDSYNTLVRGKKGIIYAICQAHSAHICEEFSSKGVRIKAIDSKTPANERKKLVSDFKNGLIEILVNVDIFSEGFDCPDIEFIQLARPTCSMAKYLQQVGRALRPCEGKDAAIILDNVGMYSRFGLPDANRQWKHHFIGNNESVEDLSSWIQNKGDGIGKVFQLKEGSEPMVLVQQSGEIPETNSVELDSQLTNSVEPSTQQTDTFDIDPNSIVTRKENNIYYLKDKQGSNFVLYMAKGGECRLERLGKNNHREIYFIGRGLISFWFTLGLFDEAKLLVEEHCFKEIDWQWTKLHIWHDHGEEEILFIDWHGNIIEDLQVWEDDYEEELKMREDNLEMDAEDLEFMKFTWDSISKSAPCTTKIIENVVSYNFRVNRMQTRLLIIEQLSNNESNILMTIDKTEEFTNFITQGYPIIILGQYQLNSWPSTKHACIFKYKVKGKWYYTDFLNNGSHPKDSIVDDMFGDKPDDEPIVMETKDKPSREGKRWTVAEDDKTKRDFSEIVQKYVELFRAMKNSTRDGEGSPHKYVMMIAVMNCICANLAHKKNLIRFNSDLEKVFNAVWTKYVTSSVYHPSAQLPFYFLHNEPFWKLVEKPNVSVPKVNTPSVSFLSRSYEGAEIDWDLYEAIQDPASYEKLKDVLLQCIKDCKNNKQ